MEEFIIQNFENLTANSVLVITWFAAIFYVAPKFVKYIRDEAEKNQARIENMIQDARLEREAFYKQLGIVNEKLEVINDNITGIHHEINNLKQK